MSDDSRSDRAGSCLCGAVKLTAKACKPNVGTCHCDMCRKWAGGPLFAVECAELAIEGEEHVKTYRASEWGERGFCGTCGTHLFWRLQNGGMTAVLAGMLDNTDGFEFDHQIFIDSKPEWYTFANETKDMTGAEVFAQFAPPDGQ